MFVFLGLPVGVTAMACRRPAALEQPGGRALLSTRVANATSLVRRTASRLLTSMGTSTNSQSTTSDIHNNDCGMLGMVTRSFPRQT